MSYTELVHGFILLYVDTYDISTLFFLPVLPV